MLRVERIGMAALYVLSALAPLFLFTAFVPGDDTKGANPNVRVWIHLSRQSFKPGETGEITITFAPAEGYHVNATPPVGFALGDSKTILLKGTLTQSVDKSNGYLSTVIPARQNFYVPSGTKPGYHVVKATVTYFYCSDAEGWCVRYRQPVTLSFTLSK